MDRSICSASVCDRPSFQLTSSFKDFGDYTPWVQKFMLSTVQHTGPRRTIPEQLVKQGTSPAKVDSVIFRYGKPREIFSSILTKI